MYYVQVRNSQDEMIFSLPFDTYDKAFNCFEWQRDTAHQHGGCLVQLFENSNLRGHVYNVRQNKDQTKEPYLFDFATIENVFSAFQVSDADREGVDIVAAHYDIGDYEGEAWVVFIKDGKWYEVHGSHCSCYGLEDQWDPEETFPEVMLRYNKFNPAMKAAIEGRMS